MSLTKQEIIDYASRYVAPEAITDFPFNGDLFCLLGRKLVEGRELKEEEGWSFEGYANCTGYTLDGDAKPAGKRLWMHFMSLATFPPSPQTIKLQPPHVVKGRFYDPSRTREFRIIKIDLKKEKVTAEKENSSMESPEKNPARGKIVPFRKKKS
jgi:hypothetical protein